jgi:hypothetical protein
MLTILSDCGDKIMTRSVTAHHIIHTKKDIFLPGELQLDCSESVTNRINWDELQLESPAKDVLIHSDEWKIAGYEVKDVEKLLEEQDLKLKHSQKTEDLSVIATICAATLGLLIISILCCYSCWQRLVKWFSDGKGCTSIVFKHKSITVSRHLVIVYIHRWGVTLIVETSVGNTVDLECNATDLTPMTLSRSPRATKSSIRNLAVGKC